MKYIVIGGVAGGATAAARIRRNTEQAEIILFQRRENTFRMPIVVCLILLEV